MANLGYMLQDKRKEATLSVNEVAEVTGLSVGTIRAYEQGRRVPSANAFRKLSDCLCLESEGQWLSATVWQSNDKIIYDMAAHQGGRPRRNNNNVIVAVSVIDDLKLGIIKRVFSANQETLEAINLILKN